MKSRPIIFRCDEVIAAIERRKTQFRRLVKPQPIQPYPDIEPSLWRIRNGLPINEVPCPYGQPGDELWVRETWRVHPSDLPQTDDWTPPIEYKATPYADCDGWDGIPWSPSIHMPRWASRLTLVVKSVLVELLQDISLRDAWAEGIRMCAQEGCQCELNQFERLWNSLYAKEPEKQWDANPWVWVIEFEVKA